MYPASVIAYAFVKRGIAEGNPVTQMKLQKMLYFAQGIHLAIHHTPLISDVIQAWKYGPVVPMVYQEYKTYGAEPISSFTWVGGLTDKEQLVNLLDEDARKTIEMTWNLLKDRDAIQLSNWTHYAGSPWEKYYKPGLTDIIIPNSEMEKFFQQYIA